jgi:catechol 2,3-dioxygenase-like lactoylglutathione lyase family enzyme
MVSGPPIMDRLDHLVLTVCDVDRTIRFYSRVLGMTPRTFGSNRVALHFGDQKINLHEVGQIVDANVRHATPGSADLCFLTSVPLGRVREHLRKEDVEVIEGPVPRTGARGPIESIYFYDPDENLIEVANRVAPESP